MSPRVTARHTVIAVCWLLPMLLALTGCGLLGRGELGDNEDLSSAVDTAGDALGAPQGPRDDREAAEGQRVSHRAAWQPPDEVQIDMAPIQAGPLVTTNGHDASNPGRTSQWDETRRAAEQPPAEPSYASAPTPSPRPSAAQVAPPVFGTVDKVGAEDFHRVVLQSDVPVLVDFYADWCGPCKRLSPTLDRIARERSDVRVVKVNIDHDKKLARKYGVQSIPTMIIFEDGNLVAQHTGLPNIQKVLGQ